MKKFKYDHRIPTGFTPQEATSLVGSKARLPLTGRIVGTFGSQVVFQPSERWGQDQGQIIINIEAIDKVRVP